MTQAFLKSSFDTLLKLQEVTYRSSVVIALTHE